MSKSSTWVPDNREDVTYFSELDLWDYGVLNFHTCQQCLGFEASVYNGDQLLALFPNLLVLDEDTIAPCVHPNCTCVMRRLAQGREEQVVDLEAPDWVEGNYSFDEVVSDFGGVW